MPENNLKTYENFRYNISELKLRSHKKIYCTCDNCGINYLREMQSHTRRKIAQTYCLDCIHKICTIKKYICNENYFAEKSLQACYWAGFISADGCIAKDKILSIGLSIKDKILLDNFKQDICFEGPVTITKQNKIIYLRINSNKICDDLANIFNIHPRKSLNHEPPIGLTEEQELAYIIGYIDGDGCISIIRNRINSSNGYMQNYRYPISLDVCGTYIFLNWLILKLKNITETNFNGKPRIITNKKISKFSTQGKFAYEILLYLKNIKIKKLERKWNKVKEINIDKFMSKISSSSTHDKMGSK
jgi:hypothetical protein